MDFATDVVVVAGLHVDVAVDLDLGFGEVIKGDPVVESVFERFFGSGLIRRNGGFDFFVTEVVQPLVKLLGLHCGCV